jgi:hypothetical protein
VIAFLIELILAAFGGVDDDSPPAFQWFKNLESKDDQEPHVQPIDIKEKPLKPIDKISDAHQAAELNKEFWETEG